MHGNLVRRRRGHRRVPHHHPLGRPKAGDIGVQLGGLRARLHQKHPLRRNRNASPRRYLLQLLHQRRIRLSQRLKLVEQRIQNVRRRKDAGHNAGRSRDPEPEPPARRRLADDPEHQQHHEPAEAPFKPQQLTPVAQPTAPSLHRQAVAQRNPMPIDSQWQIQQGNGQQQATQEDVALQPAAFCETRREVPHPRNRARRQQQPQLQQRPHAWPPP